ncbi:uncharacterized protein LOC131856157 [Cryptomeria japonica]|uniref:uncharacterized protein LOC131856157 n=1 Tax=Cryptomeria japonica TaxID=3369 RepID=UPI0027DA25FA|nr:uncharacterized protein LOC131856157 [Cryptomeria japonica]
MMSTCKYSNVVEPVRKLKKKDGFIRTKGNDGKCALPDNSPPVTARAKGTKSQYQRREMLQSCKEGLPSLKKQNRAILGGEVNSEPFKVRHPYSTKNSKSFKDKASKYPFVNSSQLKINAAATVSAKLMKKPTKVINRVNYYSNPPVIDDNIEYSLLTSEISDQELLDLNLLPDGLQQHKLTVTPVFTPKKSERPIVGGFYSFDGSRFSPMEEASLILHSPIADAYSIGYYSNSSVVSDSANTDDDFDGNFHSSGSNEQDLLDLNSLTDGYVNTPLSTPEKSDRGFDSFDGSKFSPIEEALLVLNSPNEDMFLTPLSSKETSKRVSVRGLHSFDGYNFSPIEEALPILNGPIKDPFISSVSTGVISENTPTYMLPIPDCIWNADSTVSLQSSPTQCFDPWSEETKSTSENGASYDKCSWKGSESTDSCFFYSSKADRMKPSRLASQWTTDTSALTISKKKKQRINDIGEVEWFSNLRFLSDSAVVDDEAGWGLLSSGTSEEELSSLNVLPVGLFPKKEIITSTSTTEKPKIVIAGGIHSFDGSRFSPIEQSFLIVNDPIVNEYACNTDKGGETSQVVELKGKHDFCSLLEAELLDEKTQNKKLDRILKLQTDLLEVKAQIKYLGWLLESSLRRADMLLAIKACKTG